MSGGGGSTSKQKIPKYVKEAIKPYSQQLQGFGDQYNPEFFGGQTFADMNPFTNQAAQGMGNFDTSQSQNYLQDTLGGDYLGLNPQMRNAVMNPAMDNVAARFNSMGRYGSPASQAQMAQAGMEATMPYYNQERDRQQQASQLLPGMQQLQNQQQLGGGQIYEGYANKQINEDMARFNFDQNKPYDIMQKWSSLYGPLGGAGGTMTTTPDAGSPVSGALGGMATGAAIGSAVPGIGTGIGAGIGGAMGLLGYM